MPGLSMDGNPIADSCLFAQEVLSNSAHQDLGELCTRCACLGVEVLRAVGLVGLAAHNVGKPILEHA